MHDDECGVRIFRSTRVVARVSFNGSGYEKLRGGPRGSLLDLKTHSSPRGVVVQAVRVPVPRDCAHVFGVGVDHARKTDGRPVLNVDFCRTLDAGLLNWGGGEREN